MDVDRWRRKYALVKQAVAQDQVTLDEWASLDSLRGERSAEARGLVESFASSRDLDEFRSGADEWSRREGPFHAFRGFGLMWLNQLAKQEGEARKAITDALANGLRTPTSPDDAVEKLAALESAIKPVRVSGQPAAGRKAFVLSLFWSTDPEDRTWPCLWPSAGDALRRLGWARSWENDELYPRFREISLALEPDDVMSPERYLWYLEKRGGFVGLAPGLREMCVEAADILVDHAVSGAYPDVAQEDRAKDLAGQLLGEMKVTVAALEEALENVTGLVLSPALPQLKTSFDANKPYRADAYGNWSFPGGMDAPSLRLWTTRSGVAFGAHAGYLPREDALRLGEEVAGLLEAEQFFFHLQRHDSGDRLAQRSRKYDGGELFVGWWWEGDAALGEPGLESELVDKAARLRPILDAFSNAQPRTESAAKAGSSGVAHDASSLEKRAAAFRKQRPYPTEKDAVHQERRVEFAEALSSEALSDFDVATFRKVYNGNGYGSPGPQAGLNRSLKDMTADQIEELADGLRELLWGDGPDEHRLQRAFDREILDVKGLGASVLMKLMAVAHPDRFLPVFPLGGAMGKEAILKELGIAVPDEELHPALRQVQANDALRAVLEPLFPGDAWAQGQFGYWLTRDDEGSTTTEKDLVSGLADSLMVPPEFLSEIRDLLQERKQVVFYGPPGTGKTFIARELAAALQPDPLRRRTVQFHPSTSYEDFFEGFRPRLDDSGAMTYELRKGPLALLVEKAEADPTKPHVLLIDEINRANLPRVLGELLFLLEYRKEFVYTTYRPDDPFQLPDNLLIIGTMNTADRSIAMVDAALRRRFHFVPFMPHEGPLSGVLRKFLEKHGGPVWVAGLVDAVNERLRIELKGPHLQIGHSHFMRPDLQAADLERIWTYGVYPMIEDQLYGREGLLETFTWGSVLKAHGPGSQTAAQTDAEVVAQEIDDQPH